MNGRGRHPQRAGEESMKIVIVWLAAIVALLTPAHADNAVPQFQVDPFWPKPLTKNWILGTAPRHPTEPNDSFWVGPPPRHAHAARARRRAEPARSQVLHRGAASLGIRPSRQFDPPLG